MGEKSQYLPRKGVTYQKLRGPLRLRKIIDFTKGNSNSCSCQDFITIYERQKYQQPLLWFINILNMMISRNLCDDVITSSYDCSSQRFSDTDYIKTGT